MATYSTPLPVLADKDGICHPKCDEDVVALVQYALDQQLNLRCKASGHAWPPGIASGRATFEKGFKKDPNAEYQVPTSKTEQVNIKLDEMENNKVVTLTSDDAKKLGFDWKHTWKDLNGPGEDVTVEGGLFKIGGGLVLGSNKIDGGNVGIKEGVVYNMDNAQDGYAVFDLGGIYSQTMAGYLSTGAAGGSPNESIESNVIAYNIVTYEIGTDGKRTAKTRILRKKEEAGKAVPQEETDTFHAYATSMGLLGLTLDVYVRGIPRFAIAGYEVTTNRLEECEVDLFGDGTDAQGKPKKYNFKYTNADKQLMVMEGDMKSMETYLKESKYTRLEWWPQKGVDRVVLWKADKIAIPKGGVTYPQQNPTPKSVMTAFPPSLHFNGAKPELEYPTPYQNGFLGTRDPGVLNGGEGDGRVTVLEVLSSLLLTIIGNLNNLSNIAIKWSIDVMFDESWFDEFKKQAVNILKTAGVQEKEADILAIALITLIKTIGKGLELPLIAKIVDDIGKKFLLFETKIVSALYGTFAAPRSEGGPQQFTDIWFEGLPMDKDVNYVIIPVVFTELWFPLDRSTEVMKVVEKVFDPKNGADETTLFAIEFYAGAKSDSWLSAAGPWPDSASAGEENSSVLRVDMYYFPYNSEPGVDPTDMVSNGEVFFSEKWAQISKLCAENADPATGQLKPIPFKFHLGKYSGKIASTEQYKKQYKRWDDWHRKREEMDPLSIFANEYWSEKLGINYDEDQVRPAKRCKH